MKRCKEAKVEKIFLVLISCYNSEKAYLGAVIMYLATKTDYFSYCFLRYFSTLFSELLEQASNLESKFLSDESVKEFIAGQKQQNTVKF